MGSELSVYLALALRFAPVPGRRVFLMYTTLSVHKKHNTHQRTSGPLPCTMEAITRSGTDIPSSRPTGPFFTQRRGREILRTSPFGDTQKFASRNSHMDGHLADAPPFVSVHTCPRYQHRQG